MIIIIIIISPLLQIRFTTGCNTKIAGLQLECDLNRTISCEKVSLLSSSNSNKLQHHYQSDKMGSHHQQSSLTNLYNVTLCSAL